MIVTRKEQIHLCSAIAIQTCLVSRSIYLEQALRVCAMCVRLCKLQWSRRTQIRSDQQFNSHQGHHTSSNHYFPFSLNNAACLWEPTIGLTSEDPERLQTISWRGLGYRSLPICCLPSEDKWQSRCRVNEWGHVPL